MNNEILGQILMSAGGRGLQAAHTPGGTFGGTLGSMMGGAAQDVIKFQRAAQERELRKLQMEAEQRELETQQKLQQQRNSLQTEFIKGRVKSQPPVGGVPASYGTLPIEDKLISQGIATGDFGAADYLNQQSSESKQKLAEKKFTFEELSSLLPDYQLKKTEDADGNPVWGYFDKKDPKNIIRTSMPAVSAPTVSIDMGKEQLAEEIKQENIATTLTNAFDLTERDLSSGVGGTLMKTIGPIVRQFTPDVVANAVKNMGIDLNSTAAVELETELLTLRGLVGRELLNEVGNLSKNEQEMISGLVGTISVQNDAPALRIKLAKIMETLNAAKRRHNEKNPNKKDLLRVPGIEEYSQGYDDIDGMSIMDQYEWLQAKKAGLI